MWSLLLMFPWAWEEHKLHCDWVKLLHSVSGFCSQWAELQLGLSAGGGELQSAVVWGVVYLFSPKLVLLQLQAHEGWCCLRGAGPLNYSMPLSFGRLYLAPKSAFWNWYTCSSFLRLVPAWFTLKSTACVFRASRQVLLIIHSDSFVCWIHAGQAFHQLSYFSKPWWSL